MSMKECVNRFLNLKNLQTNSSKTNGTMSTSNNQNQQSHIAVGKAKENGEFIQHIFC